MRSVLFFIIFIALLPFAHSVTINVPDDYPSIQEAIDASMDGDTILVYPGTYLERIKYNGKAVHLKSRSGPALTVIDGNGETGIVVRFNQLNTSAGILDGFTITGGSTGISVGLNGKAEIVNNIITNLGGLLIVNCEGIDAGSVSYCRIYNNVIQNNGALDYCNGIIINAKIGIIEKNIIMMNKVGILSHNKYSAGIKVTGHAPTIMHNIISCNSGGFGGGILVMNSSKPEIINNIIRGNRAFKGGGIFCDNKSDCHIVNNTIFQNVAVEGGGLCGNSSDAKALVLNSILWNNLPHQVGGNASIYDVQYCDVEGGWSGSGNISADPLFVDSYDSDFHILFQSPCKDSGTNAAPGLSDLDFEGDPRIVDGNVDMGADEFHAHLYCTGSPTPGGHVNVRLLGSPGLSPATVWCGSGVLGEAVPCQFGEWYLLPPIWAEIRLLDIPTSGLKEFPHRLGADFPSPLDIPMQALIGLNSDSLTNLSVLKVR